MSANADISCNHGLSINCLGGQWSLWVWNFKSCEQTSNNCSYHIPGSQDRYSRKTVSLDIYITASMHVGQVATCAQKSRLTLFRYRLSLVVRLLLMVVTHKIIWRSVISVGSVNEACLRIRMSKNFKWHEGQRCFSRVHVNCLLQHKHAASTYRVRRHVLPCWYLVVWP